LTLAVIETSLVRALLEREWDLSDASVTVHDGGMNSATWWVDRGGLRWVAKSVPAAAVDDFRGGLGVAAELQRSGIRTGAPVPTRDGLTITTIAGRPIALLHYVAGEALGDTDQAAIGRTLARVHLALIEPSADAQHFHWVDPTAAHLSVREWVRPAVNDALIALDALGPATLTWGMLHTDPAPEAFLRDADGVVGLIDWSVAMYGPLLYDLASAVLYVGGIERGRELVDAYLDAGALTRDEVGRGLATLLRFRWAVQADYFARRITSNDLTGIADGDGNEKGLADARRFLIAG